MGNNIIPDEGIDINLQQGMLRALKRCMELSKYFEELKILTDMGLYIIAKFSAGLRRNEVFNISLKGLLKYDMESSSLGNVLLPLLGKFKRETGLNYHLIPIANTTKIEIKKRFWMKKFFALENH